MARKNQFLHSVIYMSELVAFSQCEAVSSYQEDCSRRPLSEHGCRRLIAMTEAGEANSAQRNGRGDLIESHVTHAWSHRKAEDESKIEELEVARAELEEKLRLSEAKKAKLEQRVSALAKQNAALAKGGQATTKEGLDAVKAQLKGYSKGMEVRQTSGTCLKLLQNGHWQHCR